MAWLTSALSRSDKSRPHLREEQQSFFLNKSSPSKTANSTRLSHLTFALLPDGAVYHQLGSQRQEKSPLAVRIKQQISLSAAAYTPTATPSLVATTIDSYADSGFNKKMRIDLESANEFSSGYEVSRTELIVIMLILLLWILSLRKFVKNFEKIRTIHYREIPYKYKSKEPDNLSQVRVVKRPKEGVIYSKEPVKCSRSRSFPLDSNSERGGASVTSLSKIESNLSGKHSNKSSWDSSCSFENARRDGNSNMADDDELLLNEASAVAMSKSRRSKRSSSLDANEYKMNARQSRNQDDSGLHDQIYSSDSRNKDARATSGKSQTNSTSNRSANNFLNPNMTSNLIDTNLLSPLIKRSLLDLHAKSIENIAATASQATSSSLAHTHTILKNKEIEKKKKLRKQHAAKSVGSTGSGGGYASISNSLDRDYKSQPRSMPSRAREEVHMYVTTERTEPYQNRYTKYNKNFFNATNNASHPAPTAAESSRQASNADNSDDTVPLRYLESPV